MFSANTQPQSASLMMSSASPWYLMDKLIQVSQNGGECHQVFFKRRVICQSLGTLILIRSLLQTSFQHLLVLAEVSEFLMRLMKFLLVHCMSFSSFNFLYPSLHYWPGAALVVFQFLLVFIFWYLFNNSNKPWHVLPYATIL